MRSSTTLLHTKSKLTHITHRYYVNITHVTDVQALRLILYLGAIEVVEVS